MTTYRTLRVVTSLVIISGIFAAVGGARADYASDPVRKSIEVAFPGAQITGVEAELYKGQEVTEVELISADGTRYEVFVSSEGEILGSEQPDAGLPWIGGELLLGLGTRVEKEIYRDTDTEIGLIPFLRYENGPYKIQAYDGLSAAYRAFGTNHFSVAVKGTVDFGGGYDSDDSDYFDGMDELETIYTLGFEVMGMFAGWTAELEVAQDISGEHDGQEIGLSLTYQWNFGDLEITPTLSAVWLSQDNVDYYYGVSANEAIPGRPVYSPGSTFEIGAEIMALYPIYGDLQIVGVAEISTFGNEIKDSPLVEEDYELEFILGLVYTF